MARFDWFAHFYDNVRTPPTDKLFAIANPQKTDTVLDIGGGTGAISVILTPLVSEVFLLDPSSGMISKAKQRKLNAIRGDTDHIPFDDETFDLLICTDTFHHIQNQEQAIKEMKRVLKPAGRIIFEEYNPSTLKGKLVVFIEWLARFGSIFHTPNKLAHLLNNHGLQTTIYDEHGTYFLKATRK